MAEYNIRTFKSILMSIIIILLCAIITVLWVRQPDVQSHSAISNQKTTKTVDASSVRNLQTNQSLPANSSATHLAANGQADANSVSHVDFDFYNLLSKPEKAENSQIAENDQNVSEQNNALQNAKNSTQIADESSMPSTVAQNQPTSAAGQTTVLPVGGYYVLQLAALQDATAAVRFKQKLDSLNYPVFIQTYQQEQQLWYRINVGPYKNKTIAESVQQQLKKQRINSFLLMVNKQGRQI